MRRVLKLLFAAAVCSVAAACGGGGGGGGSAPDTTPPAVSATSPANSATNVAINAAITATFSEAVDPATVGSANFTVNNGAAGTVTYDEVNHIATFVPSTDLAPNRAYTATISAQVKDLAGNAMAADYSWSFSTGVMPDTTAPTVSATSPANNAAGVAVNAAITATFSEAVDATTVNASSFVLKDAGNAVVTGTIGYAGTTATFTPTANLIYGATYTASVTTNVKDLAGNAMAAVYSWTFTTGAAPDTTPPVVSFTTPTSSATGVSAGAVISVTFSEALLASTVTTSSFLVKDAGNSPIAGTVGYNGATATFTPSVNLAYSTVYTATITTAVQDLAGNALAANYSWSFTTGGTSSGSLDTTFGTSGKVLTAVGTSIDDLFAIAVQSDDKIVAAGDAWIGSTYDMAVVRYSKDGVLDTTFNTTGKATTAVGTSQDYANAVALQSDGKIVVAGRAWINASANDDMAVARFKSDGSLDTSFNLVGTETTTFGAFYESATAVAVQKTDGKLVAAGYASNGTNNDFAVARYNTDGSLDTSFNLVGKATTTIGAGDDMAYAAVIQSDGKIVLAGYSSMPGGSDFSLVRYNTDGSLDTSFNTTGKATTAIGIGNDCAYAAAVQADGKIIAAGGSLSGAGNSDFTLVRYKTDGTLDSTFGSGGKVTTDVGAGKDDYVMGLAIQADGKIVAAGVVWNGSDNDFALVRYKTDGTLDSTFNTTGMVITAVGAGNDTVSSVAIQSDGKIVVGGTSWNGANNDFALVRYWP